MVYSPDLPEVRARFDGVACQLSSNGKLPHRSRYESPARQAGEKPRRTAARHRRQLVADALVLLPAPVGITSSASRPPATARQTASWFSRNPGKPKVVLSRETRSMALAYGDTSRAGPTDRRGHRAGRAGGRRDGSRCGPASSGRSVRSRLCKINDELRAFVQFIERHNFRLNYVSPEELERTVTVLVDSVIAGECV